MVARMRLLGLFMLVACSSVTSKEFGEAGGLDEMDGETAGQADGESDSIQYPARCIATSKAGQISERIEVELAGPDLPVWTVWWRDEVEVLRVEYAYDTFGRLVSEAHDDRGPSGLTPDGIVDRRRVIAHSERWASEGWGAPGSLSHELDVLERVMRMGGLKFETTYVVGSDDRIERSEYKGVHPDLGAFTSLTEYAYDAEGTLASRTTADTIGVLSGAILYHHDMEEDAVIIHTKVTRGAFYPGPTNVQQKYWYVTDATGRTVRAAVDEDNDGVVDWAVGFDYAADGGVTATSDRFDGSPVVHTQSSGCNYRVQQPTRPRALGRPKAIWRYVAPSVPNAYE
jgi:hypothetical protein